MDTEHPHLTHTCVVFMFTKTSGLLLLMEQVWNIVLWNATIKVKMQLKFIGALQRNNFWAHSTIFVETGLWVSTASKFKGMG